MIVHCLPYPTGLLQFVIYNDNEQLMGAVGCQLTMANQLHCGVIQGLFVYEQFRRQGAATHLLTTVTNCLADPQERLGIEIPPLETLLATIPVTNTVAIQTFEKCHFQQLGKAFGFQVAYQFTFRRKNAVTPLH